ncbi:putative methyltransferase [Neobacillus niacini]|nr:putative methyltransferase [Neobacillus niacini]
MVTHHLLTYFFQAHKRAAPSNRSATISFAASLTNDARCNNEANTDKSVEPNTYVYNTKWNQSSMFASYSNPGGGSWTNLPLLYISSQSPTKH